MTVHLINNELKIQQTLIFYHILLSFLQFFQPILYIIRSRNSATDLGRLCGM